MKVKETITYTQQQYESITNYYKRAENNTIPAISLHFGIKDNVVRKIINKYFKLTYYDFKKD